MTPPPALPPLPARLEVPDAEAMEAFGARLAEELRAGDLVVLTGELGAGKTTLTRGLGAALGVRGAVTSPTFVLARTHPRPQGAPLVHVDAYRLSSAAELDDLDLDLEGSITVVEWGRGLIEAESWLDIELVRPIGDAGTDDAGSDEAQPRVVTITPYGPRWAQLRHEAG